MFNLLPPPYFSGYATTHGYVNMYIYILKYDSLYWAYNRQIVRPNIKYLCTCKI